MATSNRYESYRIALGRAGEQPWMDTDEIRRIENMPPTRACARTNPEGQMRRNNLLQLLAENRHTYVPMAQRIQRAEGSDEVTLYLYDPIVSDRWMAEYWGGVCLELRARRALIEAETIHLRINCPGGDVRRRSRNARPCASTTPRCTPTSKAWPPAPPPASPAPATKVLATPSSQFMVHETWTFAMGNKRDMRHIADLLDKCDQSMLAEYQRRSGNSLEQLQRWIEAETWFTAEEAQKAGFVDEVKAGGGRNPAAPTPAQRLSIRPAAQDRSPGGCAEEAAPASEHPPTTTTVFANNSGCAWRSCCNRRVAHSRTPEPRPASRAFSFLKDYDRANSLNCASAPQRQGQARRMRSTTSTRRPTHGVRRRHQDGRAVGRDRGH